MSAWEPGCTMVASSTAGSVHGFDPADRPTGSAEGTKMVTAPRSLAKKSSATTAPGGPVVVTPCAARVAAELAHCALEPGAEVLRADGLADGGGLQRRLAAVLHGQRRVTGPGATRATRPPPPGSGPDPLPAGPDGRRSERCGRRHQARPALRRSAPAACPRRGSAGSPVRSGSARCCNGGSSSPGRPRLELSSPSRW